VPSDELKGLHRVKGKRADGSPVFYYYAWRGGPRIASEFGTPEFQREFDLLHKDAAGERRAAARNTLGRVFDAYQDSKRFTQLAPRTQEDYRSILNVLRKEFGDRAVALLGQRGIRSEFLDWRDEMGDESPRRADYHWAVLNIAINWAISREWDELERNPFTKADKLYDVTRTDKIWLPNQIDAILAVAPPRIKLPFLIALYTAQRQGDILSLGWDQYDGERIELVQRKTGTKVVVKLAEPVKEAMRLAHETSTSGHVCVTLAGTPWTRDGFKNEWRKVKMSAGIQGLTFHDLRGTAATLMAMAGANELQIATITGHSIRDAKSLLDKNYLSRVSPLGDAAIDNLDAYLRAAKAVVKDGVKGM
jgi:integrase